MPATIRLIVLGILTALCFVSSATARDLATLDRISVLMTRADCHRLLGQPDYRLLVADLEIESYLVTHHESLKGAACMYEKKGILVGQILIFDGEGDRVATERLIQHGFALLGGKEGPAYLSGRDDDTGHPLVVFVFESRGATIVMSFEKTFYEGQVGPVESRR